MINKDQIEDATRAYLYSYNLALKEAKNPNFAVQVATGVVMAVLLVNKPQPQQISPLQLILESMAEQARQEAAKTETEKEAEKEGESDHDRPEDAGH